MTPTSEDLKVELIKSQQLAVDEDGEVLVWAGNLASPATADAAPAMDQEHARMAHTPRHLVEKILTSRAALEGERKQVTGLFADLKGSTELIEGLNPEQAQRLLDPALHRQGRLCFTAFIEEGVPAMTINPPRYRRSFHGPLHGVRYAKAFLDAELQKVGFAVE
jgi:hypothetical protein